MCVCVPRPIDTEPYLNNETIILSQIHAVSFAIQMNTIRTIGCQNNCQLLNKNVVNTLKCDDSMNNSHLYSMHKFKAQGIF